MWLRDVKEVLRSRLQVHWRYFSLEQVNSKEGPEWKLWERPKGYYSRGLLAFWAAEAARKQGAEAFERFHYELLHARHVEKLDIADKQVILEAAGQAGLDPQRVSRDLEDPSLLKKLGEDHTFAVEKHQIFGVPTLLFSNGGAAFLKMRPPPPKEEALQVFESLYTLIAKRPSIYEVKRPNPPVRR